MNDRVEVKPSVVYSINRKREPIQLPDGQGDFEEQRIPSLMGSPTITGWFALRKLRPAPIQQPFHNANLSRLMPVEQVGYGDVGLRGH